MRDFVDFLWEGAAAGSFAELRAIDHKGGVHQSFFRADSEDEVTDLLLDARHYDTLGWEAYVGVLPRTRPDGKAASEYTRLLWVDVDGKHFHSDPDSGKALALDALLDFPVAWNVIVDSGHGYHAYIRLDHSYLYGDVQPIMKGIAKRIGGDAVYDRSRILRLPGLSNHKGGGNAPVRLIRFDTTSGFVLSDLREYAYSEPKVHIPLRPIGGGQFGTPTLTDALVADIAFDPGKGARSEHDFKVVCRMVGSGWTHGEIVKAFLDHPQGVGAKTARSGLRYLERTIDAAHRAVGL